MRLSTLPKWLGDRWASHHFLAVVCGCCHCLHLTGLDCGEQILACYFYLMWISLRITHIFLDLWKNRLGLDVFKTWIVQGRLSKE